MPGIEPGAFHMQSERSTAELHPLMLKDLQTVAHPALALNHQNALSLSPLYPTPVLKQLKSLIIYEVCVTSLHIPSK